ncbi:baseplate J/gp47 family protein [Methylomagnum ishizawai]|uniref:baseplate J/gp47 family protein n=1 Tax=Methylomagnum ishizawai TaxID=1760988 RepID=UPI001C3236BE|nr:baseplate J/gp47 family protein [Methylomagnum ishizawai]BBL73963.1 hypothetical protein MishRS11D_10610 [Methylomagnum ishizawai]
MSTQVDFWQVLKDAGIPTTQADLETQWRTELAAVDSPISNLPAYSPFWRTVTALITRPVLWLVGLVADTVLPNAFLAYASGVFLELLADAVNLSRKPGVQAEGVVVFSRTTAGGPLTIAAGTTIRTAEINGVAYVVTTTADATLPAGELSVSAPVIAAGVGAAYNLGAGYYSILPTPINGISVTNEADWLTLPGADAETDDALRARCRNQFATASSYHTDAAYKSIIASFPGVDIDSIWFVHDAPRGPGSANAYVLFDFGADAAEYLSAINTHIMDDGNHGHGDDLLVAQMPETGYSLAVTAWAEPGTSTEAKAALQAGLENFIGTAFRANLAYQGKATLAYPYSRFSFSRLAKELHEQFPALHSIDFGEPDIVAGLWIPVLDDLDVTVEDAE